MLTSQCQHILLFKYTRLNAATAKEDHMTIIKSQKTTLCHWQNNHQYIVHYKRVKQLDNQSNSMHDYYYSAHAITMNTSTYLIHAQFLCWNWLLTHWSCYMARQVCMNITINGVMVGVIKTEEPEVGIMVPVAMVLLTVTMVTSPSFTVTGCFITLPSASFTCKPVKKENGVMIQLKCEVSVT